MIWSLDLTSFVFSFLRGSVTQVRILNSTNFIIIEMFFMSFSSGIQLKAPNLLTSLSPIIRYIVGWKLQNFYYKKVIVRIVFWKLCTYVFSSKTNNFYHWHSDLWRTLFSLSISWRKKTNKTEKLNSNLHQDSFCLFEC